MKVKLEPKKCTAMKGARAVMADAPHNSSHAKSPVRPRNRDESSKFLPRHAQSDTTFHLALQKAGANGCGAGAMFWCTSIIF
jgi:hypothetical protein